MLWKGAHILLLVLYIGGVRGTDHLALNITSREATIIHLVENHATTLNVDKFSKEPFILQTHSTTHYLNPDSKTKVFSKKNPDMWKDSIVLSSADNKWAIPTPRGAKKRQFVLLKKSPNQKVVEADSTPFYLSFVYIRPAEETDRNAVDEVFNIAGAPSVPEYDIWEKRSTAFYGGWPNCDFTALLTCTSARQIEEDAEKVNARRRRRRRRRSVDGPDDTDFEQPYWHLVHKRSAGAKPSILRNLTPITAGPGHSPGELNDLYLDFDLHRFRDLLMHKLTFETKDESQGARRKRFFSKIFGSKDKDEGKGKGGKEMTKAKAKGRGKILGMFGGGKEGGVLSGITNAVGGLASGVTNAVGSVASGVSNAVGGVVSGVSNAVGSVASGLGGAVGSVASGIGGAVGSVASGVTGAVGGLVSGVTDTVGSLTGGLIGGEGGLLGGLTGGGEGGGILGGLVGATGIGDIFSGTFEGITGALLGENGIGDIASTLVGSVGDIVSGSVSDLAGSLIDAVAGDNGLATLLGDKIGSVLGGPLSSILNPIASITGTILQPFNDAFSEVLDLAHQLPGMALSLGHEIIGGVIAPLSDMIGLGSVIDQFGLGGLLDEIGGLADQILTTGEMLLETWDTVGTALVDGAAVALVKIGVPPEWAKLAALGTQIFFQGWTLIGKGFWLGWRLGVDAVGTALNGGRYAGKGFSDDDSIPSNPNMIHGILYNGCDGGRKFFFPDGIIMYACFVINDIKIWGFFKPAPPGKLGIFDADDKVLAEKWLNQKGKLIPKAYTPPPDSGAGIAGYLRPGNQFEPDTDKMRAVYDMNEPEWADKVCVLPGSLQKLAPNRPTTTCDGRRILYGYLFPGMHGSPDIFIAEGDSISGFFVPCTKAHPNLKETPHGVFTPTHPAGHGTFTPDNPREVDGMKEVKGAFIPDGMELCGGIAGKIVQSNVDPSKFTFIACTPGVDYVYIDESPDTKNVWSPYMAPEDWKYVPPPMDDSPFGKPPPKKQDPVTLPDPDDLKNQPEPKWKKQHAGMKVLAAKSVVFFPTDYKIEGYFRPLPGKFAPVEVTFTPQKPETPFALEIVKQHPGPDSSYQSPLNTKAHPLAVLVPFNFPPDDAIVGELKIIDGRSAEFTPKVEPTAHFYGMGQQIWVPAGFIEKLHAEDPNDPSKAEEAEQIARDESRQKYGDPSFSPLLVPKPAPKPDIQPRGKYKFGPKFDPNDEDLAGKKALALKMARGRTVQDDDPTTNLQYEVVMKNTSRFDYVHGFYIKGADSPSPIFVPDMGANGVFVPEQGGRPAKAIFFPGRKEKNLPAKFVLENAQSVPTGTSGAFYTLEDGNEKSKGFLSGVLSVGGLTPDQTLDIMPGWKLMERTQVNTVPAGSAKHIPPEYLRETKSPGKFSVIDIGGGFKGVIVDGPESALDDPNNPLFQEYLHFRATKDGDVNPFGNVKIVDPLERPSAGVNPSVVAQADFVDSVGEPGTMANGVMKDFRVKNWGSERGYEMNSGDQGEPMKLGETKNVANMMDFRMYLLTKYDLKSTKLQGKHVQLYVPKASEAQLNAVKRKKLQLGAATSAKGQGDGVVLNEADIVKKFSDRYYLSPDATNMISTPGAIVRGPKRLKRQSKISSWDEDSWEEIELDDISKAKAAMQGRSLDGGMMQGIRMVEEERSQDQVSDFAKKILQQYEKKKLVKALAGGDKRGMKTDVMGLNYGDGGKKTRTTGRKLKSRRKREYEAISEFLGEKHAKVLPGWKTQHRPLEANATMTANGYIFYGLGNCIQKELPNREHWGNEPDKLIMYYLKVMRIDCMEQIKNKVYQLINDGFLKQDKSGRFFEIPPKSKLLKTIRLTIPEIQKLSVAFEFNAFTRVYTAIREKGYHPEGIVVEPHVKITRSVAFLSELSFWIVSKARQIVPMHAVRMVRNLLATLRTVLTKLHQDDLILSECASCAFDLEMTRNDKFRIVSLLQFIIHGLGPFEKKEAKIKQAFKNFVDWNLVAIKERVQEFERQFPKPKN